MNFLTRFFQNHVLANLVFILVLVVGTLSFLQLPREQDPTINFNWIDITTIVPGMAAEDVEKRVTDVLEDAIRSVADIKFVSSNSRENISNILVRFEDIPGPLFDKRVIDLRREIQNKESELPDESESPFIFEVTTANAYPSATVLVIGEEDDENLRRQSELIKKEIERIRGVDRMLPSGLQSPELQVNFDPQQLEALGISPTALADTVALHYRDLSAGNTEMGDQSWLVRLTGTNSNPQHLASLPIMSAQGEVLLGDIATVLRSRAEPRHLVMYQGKPAVMLAITKQEATNTLMLVERINAYIEEKNRFSAGTGVTVLLADDQTEITRNALRIMETNALLGLCMVLLVTWLFLGFRIALLTSIGIPFILAGTFWALQSMGQTLNVSVLLGVVISLGMLVDDAVVVVESIYYRLQRGVQGLQATLESLREVAAPVTAAVLTTMAAFLPLMLLPGILGKFMKVIPMVVTTALAISLIEAFWMLPSHVLAAKVRFDKPSRIQAWRVKWLHQLRTSYVRILTKALRIPFTIFSLVLLLFILALFAALAGQAKPELMQHPVMKHFLVKTDFFASDPLRLFYISVEMPNGTPLETTLEKTREIEEKVQGLLQPEEARAVVTYAGQMFTETAPFQGAHYGQIMVSLKPKTDQLRSVDDTIAALRETVMATPGPNKIFFVRLSGGPPTSKPISIKVRGDKIEEIRKAAQALKQIMRDSGYINDITDDDSPGLQELVLTIDQDVLRRSAIAPSEIMRVMRLLVDGEIVAKMQDLGEELEVRVRANADDLDNIQSLLDFNLPTPSGGSVPLHSLLKSRTQMGLGNIRHYNFLRTITVEADIDKKQTDTVTANAFVLEQWKTIDHRYPTITLDFSGELDDIQESIDSIFKLMLFGVLLMYVILGTQFRSYLQPMMILITIPMAFTGVVSGLLITGNPLSLYTLYGVVALAGIAVNAAIVLISAANARLASGMSVLHATLYAGRRRVAPIIITSLTTIAGLFSLATGLGGTSLLWGPVATAMVWGLLVSTILTLFIIPLLYRMFMPFSGLERQRRESRQVTEQH